MQEKQHVNYVYFAVFFFLIAFVHLFQIFLIEDLNYSRRLFYLVYTAGQCLLETGLLVLFSHILRKRFNRFFIVMMFLILLLHIIDFPLIRLMDMTVWYAIDFVLDESVSNFIEMLRASNISFVSWILVGLAGVVIPVLGLVVFRLSDRFSKKKPLHFSYPAVGIALLSVALLITIYDYNFATGGHEKAVKALPWKTTLFSSSLPTLILDQSLTLKSPESSYLSHLDTLDLVVEKKPNIFLFVVESLREDFLKSEIAPHLATFREECGKFGSSISAANATQFSWFSIYHSVHPFYWGERQPHLWESGSLPLRILKKAGYKIHLISSAGLDYYKMNEILLGKDHYLADSLQVFKTGKIHEKDSACIDSLLKSLEVNSEGNVFLIFLDSTHFNYSWPEATGGIDHLSVACKVGVEGVKDRYRNAVHFIDGLMGRFFQKLKTLPSGEEAVVVVTGDHGEEFLELGNIFHASNLSSMQTRVPIYCRLGTTAPIEQQLASHVDIFPTILHHVLGDDRFASWFDGESLLAPRKTNFAIASRYNASRTPFEFLIHDGKYQLVARFDNQKDILKSRALHLISLRDEHNNPIKIDVTQVEHEFKPALDVLFK